jgi:hypothetical protein
MIMMIQPHLLKTKNNGNIPFMEKKLKHLSHAQLFS